MNKNLNLFFFLCLVSISANAQLSQGDSLNLRRILSGEGEIRLNPNAVRSIDFGSFVGEPMMSTDRPALQYNTTLPIVPRSSSELKLTLMPYTSRTKFNYDPIYKQKVKVTANTWRDNTVSPTYNISIYSNWSRTPLGGGTRNSLEEIEASGLRYNPIGERANGIPVGRWQPTPTQQGRSGRITTTGSGSTINGLDFMKPFTREFWDKAGRKRRERTLEVLKAYGDSTTRIFNEPIIQSVVD